ncbi:hypothetical protein MWU60_06125 [Yoonia sp. F2084L]|uniref:hypothetical protein n=1 Tax=Yoonia sp. F2084L TaxID=2926419 RepID=UPI001FF621BB|nr:hypothetical protein [Yoonia sp. F2084L]MCK0095139.1 hypothetical protein [Yoonia sp. F2084L]
MGRDWIIDVLADLRQFTRENDLPMLTAQLEEAGLVAQVEIASLTEHGALTPRTDADCGLGIPTKLSISRRS